MFVCVSVCACMYVCAFFMQLDSNSGLWGKDMSGAQRPSQEFMIRVFVLSFG